MSSSQQIEKPSIPLSSLSAFDYQPRTRLIFGNDSVDQIAKYVRELGGRRVLLVTDPGIVSCGHAGRVQKAIDQAQVEVFTFDQSDQNPTTATVDRCLEVARKAGVDMIVGLGGGSAMDTAKGCNFVFSNGGRMQDYWGIGKATKPMLPMIAIPTTAGTGSECQSFALIADEKTHAKMACGDPKAAPRISILDPTLTLSQPERVTACTGIDAIAHAVETAVTKKRNGLSLVFSHEAFKLCVASFDQVLREPSNLEARGRMLLGAAFAGTAIENSMLGAAHSAANPLTAQYNIVHGQAVGMMLPHIIRFNAQDPEARRAYAELASAPEIACVSEGEEAAVAALVERIEELLDLAKMPRSLGECGVEEKAIPILAADAARQWTAGFNPRSIAAPDFEEIYRTAF